MSEADKKAKATSNALYWRSKAELRERVNNRLLLDRIKERHVVTRKEAARYSPRYDVGIIPCTAGKHAEGMTARTLYKGGGFATMMRHAAQRCDKVLIMSAKFGLITLDAPVSYYDAYLPDLSPQMRERLIVRMGKQVDELVWGGMPEGQMPRILSYLPQAYYETLIIARPISDFVLRPYKKLGMLKLTACLSAEIAGYGHTFQRR